MTDEHLFHRGLLLGIAERVRWFPLAALHEGYGRAVAACPERWARRLEEVYHDAEVMMLEGVRDLIFTLANAVAYRHITKERATKELDALPRCEMWRKMAAAFAVRI